MTSRCNLTRPNPSASHLHQGPQLLLAGGLLIVMGRHNDLGGDRQLRLGCRGGKRAAAAGHSKVGNPYRLVAPWRGRLSESSNTLWYTAARLAARRAACLAAPRSAPLPNRAHQRTRKEDGGHLQLNIHIRHSKGGSQPQRCQPRRLGAVVLAAAGPGWEGQLAQGTPPALGAPNPHAASALANPDSLNNAQTAQWANTAVP